MNDLSEIYTILKTDAKTIINDLKGGIAMWREAAAGAAASCGFIIIIILFYVRFSFSLEPIVEVRWITIGLFAAMAVLMAWIAIAGFAKYFHLKRRYSSLFEKAKKL